MQALRSHDNCSNPSVAFRLPTGVNAHLLFFHAEKMDRTGVVGGPRIVHSFRRVGSENGVKPPPYLHYGKFALSRKKVRSHQDKLMGVLEISYLFFGRH
jgi:hypothetical protein